MHDDPSWQSVFTPGSSTRYFEQLPLQQQLSEGTTFDPYTAWFLSECSRLAYVEDSSVRQEQLGQIAMQEIAWATPKDLAAGLWLQGTQCVLVFRGTNQSKNWLRNIDAKPCAWRGHGQVHQGFLKSFEACIAELEASLAETRAAIPELKVFCCGHSLGAAMASIAGLALQAHAIYNYGSPRLCDQTFANAYTNIKHYRCCNVDDLVTHLPPSNVLVTYQHIGEPIWLGEKGRKRDRFKQRLKNPELFLRSPKHLSDHAPINYSMRLADLQQADS